MRKILLAVVAAVIPALASAYCIPTTGPLVLQKIRNGDPGSTWVGCVDQSLDILSFATTSSTTFAASTNSITARLNYAVMVGTPAAGVLAGYYPSPTLGYHVVQSTHLADTGVTGSDGTYIAIAGNDSLMNFNYQRDGRVYAVGTNSPVWTMATVKSVASGGVDFSTITTGLYAVGASTKATNAQQLVDEGVIAALGSSSNTAWAALYAVGASTKATNATQVTDEAVIAALGVSSNTSWTALYAVGASTKATAAELATDEAVISALGSSSGTAWSALYAVGASTKATNATQVTDEAVISTLGVSTNAASGTGACTLPNVVTGLNAHGAPTCGEPSNTTGNAATASIATNIAGCGAGAQILFNNGNNSTTCLGNGAANNVLVGNGSGGPFFTTTVPTLSMNSVSGNGAGFTMSTNTVITGSSTVQGAGGLSVTYGVVAGTVTASTITVNADGALPVPIPNAYAQVTGKTNGPIQIVCHNQSNGVFSACEFVLMTDLAGNTTHWASIGIGGSKYSEAAYSLLQSSMPYIISADQRWLFGSNQNNNPLYQSGFGFVVGDAATSTHTVMAIDKTSATVYGAGGELVTYGIKAGSASFTGGLVASSGTFFATGAAQFSLQTSSGILVPANTPVCWGSLSSGNCQYGPATAPTVYGSSCIVVNSLPAGSSTASTFVTGSAISSTLTFTNPAGYDVLISWGGNAANLTGSGANCVVAPLVDSTYIDAANPSAGILNSFAAAGYGPMSYPPRSIHLGTGNHTISWMIRNTGGGSTCATYNDGNNQNWMQVCRTIAEPF